MENHLITEENLQAQINVSMAFQPIVDLRTESAYAYEALVRGPRGESAGSVLQQISPDNSFAFDQCCRMRAIALAKQVGLAETGAGLSINMLPSSAYSPAAGIALTLQTAERVGFPLENLIFEITETECIEDKDRLQAIADDYRSRGFKIALDDFGACYSGLNLLAAFRPDILKLDMGVVRDIDRKPASLAIVRAMTMLCKELGVDLIAEGIETAAELDAVRSCGVQLVQGYFFAKPAFEALPAINLPETFLALNPSRRATRPSRQMRTCRTPSRRVPFIDSLVPSSAGARYEGAAF